MKIVTWRSVGFALAFLSDCVMLASKAMLVGIGFTYGVFVCIGWLA